MNLLIPLALACLCGQEAPQGIHPARPRCEYRADPLGIDAARPRLSWELESGEPGQRQTAYQILAASDPGKLAAGEGDLWDSGRVESGRQIYVEYAGKPLRSGQRVHWKVRAWDRAGRPSPWSAPAAWEMALLDPADWGAAWITRKRDPVPEDRLFDDHPAPLFRKEFAVRGKVARARAYVSGLGYYELRLNGERVGDHLLDPGWTSFSKRVLYSTYDVTGLLKEGPNAVGAVVGNGWYNPLPLKMWGRLNLRQHLAIGPPRLILRLAIEYADGASQAVVTDPGWKTADGPILRNSVYLGEVYDARREIPGWDRPGFDDARWEPAVPAGEPLGPLRAQHAPPIRVTRTIRATKLSEPRPGVFIFDLGENFAGWARLRVRGPAGTRVTMRLGELLHPDGTLNGMTAVCGQVKQGGPAYRYDGNGYPGTAFQQDACVLRGEGEEVYTPRFTFHGFRYVEVTGFPGKPPLEAVEGLALHSDVRRAGTFSCSDDLFNRIEDMVLRTQLSNMFSVQSDCPQREKFGYGGDIVAAGEMALLHFDMARFYAKAVEDLADAVRPNGGMTETAPYVGISDEGLGDGAGPVGWGTAFPFLLLQLHRHYGDRRLLEEHYPAAQKWMAFLEARAKDHILDNGISDHESLVPKPRAHTGTGFYCLNADLMAGIARALGRPEDAGRYAGLAGKIREAFNRKFLRPGTGTYDTGTQCCQAFALYLDLVPPEERRKALEVLVADIREKHGGHLTTGIFGTKFMLQALTDLGRGDAAAGIVGQKTFPGWGHMLERGATTLWEHWEYSDNVYSHNHPMFGSVSEWFMKGLAGIRPAPDAEGFDRIEIRPCIPPGLEWVKAAHDTVRGRIEVEWRKEGGRLILDVTVPPNTSAVVAVPGQGERRLEPGRHRLMQRE